LAADKVLLAEKLIDGFQLQGQKEWSKEDDEMMIIHNNTISNGSLYNSFLSSSLPGELERCNGL
jgi:hypothetical protein